MLRSEVAAIRTRPPFDDEIVSFLDTVSKIILKNDRAKAYGDVIAFGFWCRKASVLQMKKGYADLTRRAGQGLAFHIAPSNVAVMFAYSLAVGLLSGNGNVVRLPSKEFPQIDLISAAIDAALESFPGLAPYIQLVRYGHEKKTTDELSAMCDIRLIWGGDNTIREIRQSPLAPRAIDIAFANRYSLAVINGAQYAEMPDKVAIARRFYNDTYLTDQNACSSPKLIVWLGAGPESAREEFWAHVDTYAKQNYTLQSVQAVHKLSRLMALAMRTGKARYIGNGDNLICRVEVESLTEDIFEYSGHSGFFMEYRADNLQEILPVCGKKCQTLSYLGVDKTEIERFLSEYSPRGIDRVVPMGKTMDFSLVWDGFDLIETMSKKVDVV